MISLAPVLPVMLLVAASWTCPNGSSWLIDSRRELALTAGIAQQTTTLTYFIAFHRDKALTHAPADAPAISLKQSPAVQARTSQSAKDSCIRGFTAVVLKAQV